MACSNGFQENLSTKILPNKMKTKNTGQGGWKMRKPVEEKKPNKRQPFSLAVFSALSLPVSPTLPEARSKNSFQTMNKISQEKGQTIITIMNVQEKYLTDFFYDSKVYARRTRKTWRFSCVEKKITCTRRQKLFAGLFIMPSFISTRSCQPCPD